MVRQKVCWLPVVPAPARRERAAEFRAASGNQQTQRSELGFPVRPSQLEPPNAQEFSFASSRSGVRIPLAPQYLTRSGQSSTILPASLETRERLSLLRPRDRE